MAMLEQTLKLKTIILSGISVIAFSVLAICYLAFADRFFYMKNIFNNNITLVFPLPYLILIMVFIYSYSYLTSQSISRIAYPIIAMMLAVPFLYLLTDLKIGMSTNNPFGGNRGIFTYYVSLYYFFALTLFSILTGLVLRKSTAQGIIFHMPLFICFAQIEAMLFSKNFTLWASAFFIFFICAFTFSNAGVFLKKAWKRASPFLMNEKLLLVAIFILAFLIRYYWGVRLLSIAGENFTRASDDGLCYNLFATIIAQGGTIPKDQAFYWSGFGYWYLLGAIYKVFGLYNFKAMIIIQSLLGAAIPPLTYLIGKRVFNSRFVGVAAALITTFHMNLIFLSTVMGAESVYIPILMIAMTGGAYFMTGKKHTYPGAFIFGAALGLANCCRSEALFFPLIFASLFFIFKRKYVNIRKIVFLMAVFFAGFICLMSIQHTVSFAKYGSFRLTSGALDTTYAGDWCTNENTILSSLKFNPFVSVSGSISVFLRDPKTIGALLVKGFVKRMIIYYFKPNFGVFDPISLVNPASGYFFRFSVWTQFYQYLFVFIGIFFIFRNKISLLANSTFLIFIVYISSMYAFIWVTNARHKGVLIPFGALFLAYGVYIFYGKIKDFYLIKDEKARR